MPYYPQGPKEPPKKPPLKEQPLFRLVLLCLSVLLVCYGAFRLIGYGADWITSRNTSRELREIAAATEPVAAEPVVTPVLPPETAAPPTAEPAPEPTAFYATTAAETAVPAEYLPAVEYPGGMNIVPRIRDLRKKSEYIMGWLTMDDLDEPVAFKDNDFFLNHDAKGNRNGNGALFMDENTRLMTRPYTILVYGHNMKTGAMFGNLHRYEQTAYCNRHRILRFDTLYEEGQYAIFAVATIRLTPGTAGYVSLTDLRSDRRETRRKALNALTSVSVYNNILDVNEEDQLLLLVTCVGDDDQRLIVAARRLRENESPDNLVLKNGGNLS